MHRPLLALVLASSLLGCSSTNDPSASDAKHAGSSDDASTKHEDASEKEAPNRASLPKAGGRWIARAAMPTSRSSFGYTVIGDRLYVVGGAGESGESARVDIYDPARDAWSEGPALPYARESVAAASVGETLCVFGGLAKRKFIDETACLDTKSGSWKTMKPLSSPRSLLGAVTMNGRIWTIGGRDDGHIPTKTVESFDPIANEWRAETSLPEQREGAAPVVVNGSLLVAGGFYTDERAGDLYFDEVLELDVSRGEWTSRAHLTEPAVALAGAAVGPKHALFVGGYVDTTSTPFLPRAEGVDVNAWTPVTIAPMPAGRGGLGVAVVADRIFAFGGSELVQGKFGWTPTNTVWELVD